MVDEHARKHWIGVLRQLLLDDSVVGVCDWNIRSGDESLVTVVEDLQHCLLFVLPVSPDGNLQQQAIEVHRSSIERAIMFLQAGCEFPPETWISKWWFALTLVVGVSALFAAERWRFSFFKLFAAGLLGGLVLILWLSTLLGGLLMGWQVVQVRLLRRDLVPAAIEADKNGHWPFETAVAKEVAFAKMKSCP